MPKPVFLYAGVYCNHTNSHPIAVLFAFVVIDNLLIASSADEQNIRYRKITEIREGGGKMNWLRAQGLSGVSNDDNMFWDSYYWKSTDPGIILPKRSNSLLFSAQNVSKMPKMPKPL